MTQKWQLARILERNPTGVAPSEVGMERRKTAIVGLVVLWVLGCLASAQAENPCATCHEEQVQAVAQTVHQRAAESDASFCVACHGNPDKHLETGDKAHIRGKETLAHWQASEKTSACLSCHRASRLEFLQSPHDQGQVSCWSCHLGVWHQPANIPGEPCSGCHLQETASFRRAYHHPVPEGKLKCVSCHDPHRQQSSEELGRERCVQCHREAEGPFVFPHLASEDGCVTCHAPHGSTNRTLPVTAGNGLCVRCHSQSNFPGVGKVPHNFNLAGGGRCFDCHSEPHGSNVSPLLAPRLLR